jgi:hypothetical protein
MFGGQLVMPNCSAIWRQYVIPELGVQEEGVGAGFSGWLTTDPEDGAGALCVGVRFGRATARMGRARPGTPTGTASADGRDTRAAPAGGWGLGALCVPAAIVIVTSTAIDAVARPLAIAPAPARTRVPHPSGRDHRMLRGTAAGTPSRGAAL